MDGDYLRLHNYVQTVEAMTDEERKDYFADADWEARRPARKARLIYSEDLSRNPNLITEDVSCESDDDVKARMMKLLEFIRTNIGRRCADAAEAIMSGAQGCKEIGEKMGVCRHTAIGHVKNLQSQAVQNKAIELGLVTRGAFIQTVMKTSEHPTKQKKAKGRKSDARAHVSRA